MLTAESALALFLMLALASVTYYIANRFKLPYTVLLTLLGVLLVPISAFGPFEFVRGFQLTPELLFFIFLPTLLFESAYNMNIRRVVDEATPIFLLAVVGYLLSSFLIGGGLYLVLGFIGLSIPFIVALLFGALISATDPVAVLSLFKEYGAPRRLTLIFEGESLANDATALALFVVVLSLVEVGLTTGSIVLGGVTFFAMLIGGAVVGLIVGAIIISLLGFFRENEIVAVTLMVVMAHLTFLVAEILNENMAHAGLQFIQFSPIIATTVASLLMGNYGRFKVTPHAEEFVDKFWSQFAFMANSIVFILVGLLFASIPTGAESLILPVLATIVIVAVARAVSIYGTMVPFNLFAQTEKKIPFTWMHLLAWGSLRGALAVMIVLLIPPDLQVQGWSLDLSVQQFLLVLTVSCIFATLFIKAPTIGPMIKRLKVDALTDLEVVAEEETQALIYGVTIFKIKGFAEKGYIPADIAETMIKNAEERFRLACRKCLGGERAEDAVLAARALQLYVLGFEHEILKELFAFGEINERIFKRINGKLTLQYEAIERGNTPDTSASRDSRDVFENSAEFFRSFFKKETPESAAREQLLYYRGQQILARKVVKELSALKDNYTTPVFDKETLFKTIQTYEGYKKEATEKAEAIRAEFPKIAATLDQALAFKSVYRVKERYLDRFFHRGLLTPKLFIKLQHEYEEEMHTHQISSESHAKQIT